MKIEIKDTQVITRSGTNARGNWQIREQTAYAHTLERNGNTRPYPEQINVSLEDNQAPYAPGFYEVTDQSFYVGRFNVLTIGRLILRPIAVQQKVAA